MPMRNCDAGKHYFDPNLYDSCPYCMADEIDMADPNRFSQQEPVIPPATHDDNRTVRINDYNVEDTLTKVAPARNQGSNKTQYPSHSNKTQFIGFGEHNYDDYNQTSQIIEEPPVVGWLVIVEGAGKGRDFRLIQGVNNIGLDRNLEVSLDFGEQTDKLISHSSNAAIVYDIVSNVFFAERGQRVTNLPRLNDNVLMNGVNINNGDIIQVGKTKLMLVTLCDNNFSWI